ncbi:iron transporter [Massilia atriviolacea]|uniref:Iron transporter n=1 Tax=Massilia atriviolacea TaxID=2495579 RepID=A0A430HP20_9BURK|nr:iron transporter [Massilia atriviolacea]RSZ59280.1 iron transporter [Massilia atriviolacea]
MRAAAASSGVLTGLRVIGAVFGGYAVTALGVSTAAALLARLGMARSEAVALAAMTGFIVYLLLLLWAFSVQSVLRLWTVLALAMAAMGAFLYFLA